MGEALLRHCSMQCLAWTQIPRIVSSFCSKSRGLTCQSFKVPQACARSLLQAQVLSWVFLVWYCFKPSPSSLSTDLPPSNIAPVSWLSRSRVEASFYTCKIAAFKDEGPWDGILDHRPLLACQLLPLSSLNFILFLLLNFCMYRISLWCSLACFSVNFYL